MQVRISELKEIEDATAYWLYADESYDVWQLEGRPTVSSDATSLRLELRQGDETFELVLFEQGDRLFAKFDDRERPEVPLPATAFRSEDELLVTFQEGDDTVFLRLSP